MSGKPFVLAGGAFAPMHAALMGEAVAREGLDPTAIAPDLVERARATWQERVHTEYRSAQLMNRFLMETLAAGDPFDIHAGAVELIADELRHVALCAEVVRALGGTPTLPSPLEVNQPEAFQRMSASQRALSIAITMILVNETLSVGYIRDLAARCQGPVVRDVLRATLEDEAEHEGYGESYVRYALARFPIASLGEWRKVATTALDRQQRWADAIVAALPPAQRSLEAHPDEALVPLGLFSNERQALVFQRTFRHELLPLLRSLDLWSE